MARAFHSLFKFRYLTFLAVIGSLTGSFLLLCIGLERIFEGIVVLFTDIDIHTDMNLPAHLSEDGLVTVLIVQAVDVFLFALVLMIFGIGIYTLFILDPDEPVKQNIPPWLQINSIGELKTSLAGVIIIILFVNVLENIIIVGYENLAWEVLIIPITIALLAVALYLLPKH
jgi:uncharacterized membrane protein YqhA